jgi:hypothetical protein
VQAVEAVAKADDLVAAIGILAALRHHLEGLEPELDRRAGGPEVAKPGGCAGPKFAFRR